MLMKRTAMPHMASILLLISLVALPAASQEEEIEIDERLGTTAESQAEFEAATAIDAEESALNVLTMTDAFLTEYPESEFRPQILLTRLQTYVDLNNNQGILTTGDAYVTATNTSYDATIARITDPAGEIADTSDVEGLSTYQVNHFVNLTFTFQSMMNANLGLGRIDETERYGNLAVEASNEGWNIQSQVMETGSPEYQEANQGRIQAQLFFLQTVMSAHQNANDVEKTIEYAERSLSIDPQSLASLITISSVLSERPPESALFREEHFESAEEYADQALDVLERFLDVAGDQMGAQQSANLLSSAHFTLGTVYFHQEEWGDAQDEFEEALELVPTNAVAYLRLGMAYVQDEEPEDAMEALARSIFLDGSDQARELLEQIYEIRNDGLTGIEAFIQSQGAEINR